MKQYCFAAISRLSLRELWESRPAPRALFRSTPLRVKRNRVVPGERDLERAYEYSYRYNMPDPVDNSAEAQPLREAEGEVVPPGKAKEECQKGHHFAHLSRWHTAAFFLSLFLCLTVVFAFSFIIPCPIRPIYLRFWNHTYNGAETYDFLAVEDANKDKILDILFVLKAFRGSLNTSCTTEGKSSSIVKPCHGESASRLIYACVCFAGLPCLFFLAAAGTNGQILWERALDPEFQWAQCGIRGLGGMDTGCLFAHAQQLTAVDKYTGNVLWQQPHPPSISSHLPVLMMPDLDGDDVGDLVLVEPGQVQTKLAVVSGKTGGQIGSDMVLNSTEASRHLLHTTGSGSHYLLFQTVSVLAVTGAGLYALPLWRVAAQARTGSEAGLKRDQVWEKKADGNTGQLLLYSSMSLQWVVQIPRESRGHNLLLVSAGTVELVDGDSLQSLWRVNVSRVLSEPTTGYFNKDDIPDVVMEDGFGNGTKQVVILDGKSGAQLWDMVLLVRPNTPMPTSVRTIHTVSVFVFWGEVPLQQNSSSTNTEGCFIYMLHPQHPQAVLENSVSNEHIISFKATLLERGRHASFITLMDTEGAVQGGLEDAVTLTKRKLKENVPDSRVCWLEGVRGDDQAVKRAFENLRFRQNP
ncbi:protein FAM234A-like isoform X1 [Arapaima gigas]